MSIYTIVTTSKLSSSGPSSDGNATPEHPMEVVESSTSTSTGTTTTTTTTTTSSITSTPPPAPADASPNKACAPHVSLLKLLLRLLTLVLHSPRSGGGLVAFLVAEKLPECLHMILSHWRTVYGSSLCCLGMYSESFVVLAIWTLTHVDVSITHTITIGIAISVIASVMQAEPSSYISFFETKLPEAVLTMIQSEVYPQTDGLGALANALTSIAIHENGIQAIQSSNALEHLLQTMAPERCGKLRDGYLVMTGSILNELFRHHAALRPGGMTACYRCVERLLAYGEQSNDSDKQREYFLDYVVHFSGVCLLHLSQPSDYH
jgi:hypothetical protein